MYILCSSHAGILLCNNSLDLMSQTVQAEIRPGAYYDSVVLMQLQRNLAAMPGIFDAGVVMGTRANQELLAQSDLLTPGVQAASPDDLVIVVRAENAAFASAALSQVDAMLHLRQDSGIAGDYQPKTLEAAVEMAPNARWVLVSTPGRYAAGLASDAVRLGKHVFLYSDHVALEDELALKQQAYQCGLLVMGSDCGTAIINGVGLGFANRVRRGPIGLVGASGTGLQYVTTRIHQLGGGVTHALGTGGRDLSETIGGVTARQALDLLARDPVTQVIVLISKPPAPQVAGDLLRQARAAGKPVIVDFMGYQAAESQQENLYFVKTLDAAAELAVALAACESENAAPAAGDLKSKIQNQGRYLRGLYAGGTLAYEALSLLQDYLPAIHSNAPLDRRFLLENAMRSHGHTILDLGADEFTVGRLHPMLDNTLRIKRLHQEAADPETAIILLDVVLGHGAHPDPAGDLAPAIATIISKAKKEGRELPVVAIVVGTDEDPQSLDSQVEQLRAAGAHVEFSNEAAVRRVGQLLASASAFTDATPVDLAVLQEPLAAINVGLAAFTESLTAQGAPVIHVDWRPPAGGNERLAGILARMKQQA
jgi:FdrA protein